MLEKSAHLYCECPACEYSAVVRGAYLITLALACPRCEADTRRIVKMTSRPALDSDKPEGVDARRRGGTIFVCTRCGRTCLTNWTEEEARAEFERLYNRPFDPAKHPPVCDDCHRAVLLAATPR